MFCPYCGVKNDDGGQTECFVCGKKLPSLNGYAASATPSRSRPASRAASAGPVMARLGDRLIAIVLDMIFVGAILLVASAAIVSRRPKLIAASSALTLCAIGAASTILVVFLYHWLLEGAFGATMGKAIIGVRVTRFDTGRPPGLGLSAIRNALRVIDALPFYGIGFFVAVFSSARRRIGDYAANTVVLEHAGSLGERVTVVLLWLVGIGAAVWGTWALCPAWFHFPIR